MKINTRNMGFKDVLPLISIYLSLSEETRRFFHPFKFNRRSLLFIFTYFSLLNKISKYIKKITPKFFVLSIVAVDEKNVPTGFAYVYRLSKLPKSQLWEAEDFGIVVGESYRNLGIGSKLIKEIISISTFNNIKKINLTVLAENETAINLYKKYGFKLGKYYEEREFWDGKIYPDYDMRLDLE